MTEQLVSDQEFNDLFDQHTQMCQIISLQKELSRCWPVLYAFVKPESVTKSQQCNTKLVEADRN